MEFLQPGSLAEALAAKAERPGAVPIAGGTDVMVEINFDTRRPEALLDLNRVPELASWELADGRVRLGACLTYARLIAETGGRLPGLAMAARTIGSPQIRNRGTIGGNLGAASPAGDCHPVLLATGATVQAASVRGTRLIPAEDFYLGPKRSALADDELITAVLVPLSRGPQQFAKIGSRNAMVIAVCAFALDLRPDAEAGPVVRGPVVRGPVVRGPVVRGTVGTGIGSAGPTPLRAAAAEEFLAGTLAESGLWTSAGPLPGPVVVRFGELVAQAAQPIDDVRGTAAYRRHALSVLARRTLAWAWDSFRQSRGQSA
jgi:CO/xanthine dehydrogenase FAD-binding subunit